MFPRPNHHTSTRSSSGLIEARPACARGRSNWLLLVVIWGTVLASSASFAAPPAEASRFDRLFYCDADLDSAGADSALVEARQRKLFDAQMDVFNGLVFIAGGSAISLGGEATRRWSSNNRFDDGLRGGLRGSDSDAREAMDTAGDFGLALSVGVIPFMTIGAQYFRTHDCLETFDMTTDWVESFGLTLFITQTAKNLAGRTRPYTEACDSTPAPDARCGADDRFESFISGHASLAGAGAGLTCAFSLKREAWGSSRTARIAPCALGVTAALATGLLRLGADRHWGIDVISGLVIGGAVGYFDTWGPFDLLKFETRNSRGRISSKGMVLPSMSEGRLGAQLVMVF